MYGSLTFCHTAISQFLMADISFNIACKELKIAQIAQLNQLFQLLHLGLDIYGHGFYELSRMLMRKNVNDDVSKGSPIDGLFVLRGLNLVKCKGFLSSGTKKTVRNNDVSVLSGCP